MSPHTPALSHRGFCCQHSVHRFINRSLDDLISIAHNNIIRRPPVAGRSAITYIYSITHSCVSIAFGYSPCSQHQPPIKFIRFRTRPPSSATQATGRSNNGQGSTDLDPRRRGGDGRFLDPLTRAPHCKHARRDRRIMVSRCR